MHKGGIEENKTQEKCGFSCNLKMAGVGSSCEEVWCWYWNRRWWSDYEYHFCGLLRSLIFIPKAVGTQERVSIGESQEQIHTSGWIEVEQGLRSGDEMETQCQNPGRIDELTQGCKGDVKSWHLQGRSNRTWWIPGFSWCHLLTHRTGRATGLRS